MPLTSSDGAILVLTHYGLADSVASPPKLPLKLPRMTTSPELAVLAARWEANPTPVLFAALADGLRKQGDLLAARDVVAAGVEKFPDYLPGWLVSATIARQSGDLALAAAAEATGRLLDPSHPMLPPPDAAASVEELDSQSMPPEVAPADDSAEADFYLSFDPDDESMPMVTESLAALYHRQGHLNEAADAYRRLASRNPSNAILAARHAEVIGELAARQPIAFDSKASGGESLVSWLNRIASAEPQPAAREAGYDAFYETPPAPADATADFDAFQQWLRELEK